jgi:hypothetical protein
MDDMVSDEPGKGQESRMIRQCYNALPWYRFTVFSRGPDLLNKERGRILV